MAETPAVAVAQDPSIAMLDWPLQVAFYAAANALLLLDRSAHSMGWMSAPGAVGPGSVVDRVGKLGAFVRMHPSAPPEALWRYAHGQGVHTFELEGFHAAPAAQRLPYRMFAAVLPTADAEAADEAALAAAARRDAVAATAVAGPADLRGTVLEQHGSVTDRV